MIIYKGSVVQIYITQGSAVGIIWNRVIFQIHSSILKLLFQETDRFSLARRPGPDPQQTNRAAVVEFDFIRGDHFFYPEQFLSLCP